MALEFTMKARMRAQGYSKDHLYHFSTGIRSIYTSGFKDKINKTKQNILFSRLNLGPSTGKVITFLTKLFSQTFFLF